MIKYLASYFSILIVVILLDVLWLGFLAKPLYQEGIGHLMAEKPNLVAAFLFYIFYCAGIVIFVISPNIVETDWKRVLYFGLMFGFFCYATYDLSNLATLKAWPVSLTALDIAWGTVLSGVSSIAGMTVWKIFKL